MKTRLSILILTLILTGCTSRNSYDVIIRNGTIYDGTGSKPYKGDLAIRICSVLFVAGRC